MNVNKLWKKYAHVYCTEANAVSMDKQGFTEAIGEILSNPVEAEVKPACETIDEHCLFCNKKTTVDDMKYKDKRVCQKCTDYAVARYLDCLEQGENIMEENFSEMQTVQSRQIERIVMRTAEEKDNLIKDAITFILGNEWTIKSITERCVIKITPDKREIFCLDDKPLLEFYPIETFIDHKDLGVSMKVSQKYRKLYA